MDVGRLKFLTTAYTIEEARREIEPVGVRMRVPPEGIAEALGRFEELPVTGYTIDAYRLRLLEAKDDCREAERCRSFGAGADVKMPILTQDKDFDGCGVDVTNRSTTHAVREGGVKGVILAGLWMPKVATEAVTIGMVVGQTGAGHT